MRKQILTVAVLTGCTASTVAGAVDVDSNTKVGGEAFFDFGYIKNQAQGTNGAYTDTAPTGTGFDVKRFYLIADHKFNDIWSADLTLDAQYSTSSTATVSTPGGGTTTALTNGNTSGGVTEVMVKKLYLEAKLDKAFVGHIGAYTSPWAPFVESVYGYRYIEKTVTDRLGFAQTADWGLNATGVLGPKDIVSYSLSVVNGGGYKNPTRTKSPDVEGRVGVKPVDWLTLGAGFYAGHLAQVNASNQDFPYNTATRWDLLAGINLNGFRFGGEYFDAKNYKTVNSAAAGVYGTSAVTTSSAKTPVSDEADGFSVFTSYTFNDQWSVFGRYDDAKLSKNVDKNLKDKYFNAGVAFKPLKSLDLALVYKNEKVDNGSNSISGANANASYTIGGANALTSGKFDEIGFYARFVY